jgi:pimeloyl-ACP methyl ester carboxylesterase
VPFPQILAWAGNALVLWERQEDGHTWHPFGLEEMIPATDGWESLNPYDMNDNGAIVGTGWYTDPSDPQARSELHAFMLVPVELMVDGNRDREMSFDDLVIHDQDRTSEEKPYRFWVNDDQDAGSGTNISDEVTPPQLRDYQDEKIQSIRDCEDLARLWLNMRGLTEGFKTGAIKLVLKFRNITSGNPAIRAFRAVENGGRGYVTSEAWGILQATPPFDQALRGTNGPGIASSATGIYVDRQFWAGIDESDPVINLLFEGVQEGKGELYCEIISDGQRIGASPGVWLDITNVQKMYERAKGQPENIVAPYLVSKVFTGPVSYVSDPNGNPFEKSWDETDQCVVFVHGWNVSYDEYVGVAQTLFKRLWHQGFKGHFASFRWDTRKSDSAFDPGEYNRSENRAFVYGDSLKACVTSLSNKYSVSVVGHSMGNVVCGEALRQGMQVRNYVLMEAAIPMSCYDSNAQQLARLTNKDTQYPTPDHHIDTMTNEQSFGYRGYLENVSGTFTNFYNQDDWALSTGFTIGLETNWEKNQIDYKPDGAVSGVVHAGTWSYHYDPSQPPVYALPQRAWVVSSASRNVSDSWEIKSFVARSRTKAVGAFLGGGSLGATENLREDFGFRNVRADHSGQFTRNIQAVEALYKRIRAHIEE